jgi:hypothetical protein
MKSYDAIVIGSGQEETRSLALLWTVANTRVLDLPCACPLFWESAGGGANLPPLWRWIGPLRD